MSESFGWKSDEDIERYIAEISAVLDLRLEPEYLPNIVMYLRLAAEMANTVNRVDLDAADADLAPVFRLPRPPIDD